MHACIGLMTRPDGQPCKGQSEMPLFNISHHHLSLSRLLPLIFCMTTCVMQAHDALLNKFLHYVELYGTDVAKWTTEQAHTCFCACMLHVADISNGCKDIKVAAFWAGAITLGERSLLSGCRLPIQ